MERKRFIQANSFSRAMFEVAKILNVYVTQVNATLATKFLVIH